MGISFSRVLSSIVIPSSSIGSDCGNNDGNDVQTRIHFFDKTRLEISLHELKSTRLGRMKHAYPKSYMIISSLDKKTPCVLNVFPALQETECQ